LIAFLLPFVTFSCAGQHVTMNGIQLATGSIPSELASMGMTPKDLASKTGFSGDLLTLCALLAAGIGLALSLVGASARRPTILVAALAAVSLAASRANLLTSAVKEGQGLLTIQFELGFWLAFLAFGAAIATCIMSTWDLAMFRQQPKAQAAQAPLPDRT